MFLGHFGAGMAAKNFNNKPSLGTLFLASQFIDLLWPVLLITGVEKVVLNPESTKVTHIDFIYYPFSHSLMGVLFWAVLFGLVYFLLKKNIRSSVFLGALVLSHWILDVIVHKPDLPLTTGNNYLIGLGAWNSYIVTLIIEFSIFITGAYFYLSVTEARNKKGTYLIWSLLVFLSIIYLSNIFGPPPPDPKMIGYAGLAQWLIIIWAYWADHNRILREKSMRNIPELQK